MEENRHSRHRALEPVISIHTGTGVNLRTHVTLTKVVFCGTHHRKLDRSKLEPPYLLELVLFSETLQLNTHFSFLSHLCKENRCIFCLLCFYCLSPIGLTEEDVQKTSCFLLTNRVLFVAVLHVITTMNLLHQHIYDSTS